MAECFPCCTYKCASMKYLYGEVEDIATTVLGRATTDGISTKTGHSLKDIFRPSQQERFSVSEISSCDKQDRAPKHS